jgi:hypothetical protein
MSVNTSKGHQTRERASDLDSVLEMAPEAISCSAIEATFC